MNRTIVGLAAVAALVIATPLLAQQRGQGRGRGGLGGFGVSKLQLVQAEPVQKELELVGDQKDQITKIAEDARAGRRGGGGGFDPNATAEERAKAREEAMARTREIDKKVDAVLVGPQKTRLNEIYIQALGTAALSNEDVAKELGISKDLQEKIAEARREAMQGAFQGGGGGGFNAEAITKARKEADDKALALLSSEQKEKFEKMKGKAVSFDLTTIGRGGRGQRRGGGGNNN
jgi:hypothetical protein